MSITLRRETNLYDDDAIADGISGAISTYDSSLGQTAIFNKLTNNGTAQGIFMQNGQLYINMTYLQTGTLKLGGANNGNGIIAVYDASGNEIGRWDKDGLSAIGNLTMQNARTVSSITSTANCNVGYTNMVVARAANVSPRFIGGDTLGFVLKCVNTNSKLHYCKSIDMYREYTGDTTLTYGTTTRSVVASYAGSGWSGGWNSSVLNIRSSGTNTLQTYAENNAYAHLNETVVPNINGASYVQWQVFGYEGSTTVTNASIELGGKANIVFNDTPYIGVGSSYYISCPSNHIWGIKDSRGSGNIEIASSSSKRYKHDITTDIDENLDAQKLYGLPMKQFVFNEDHPTQYADMKDQTIPGFIAEDVAEIYPAAVIHDADGEIESWDERRIIPGMLALIQEQKKQLDEQAERIAKLENQTSFIHMM